MTATRIRTRPLGHSTIDATEIGLGLWAMGGGWGPVDDQNSLDAIEVALDAGVNFYDTADVYGMGHSEELLGRAMKGRRDRFFVASKIGWIGYDGETNRSRYHTPDQLIAGVEESLTRLGTDHLDLIQCHIHYPEANTPVFIAGFQKLKQQGKVRAFGVSTSSLQHLQTFNQDDDCDALQVDYSILNRTPEADLLPYCRAHDIGVIVRGPLAMGILTGKFPRTPAFPEGDFRQAWINDPEQSAAFQSDLDTVDQLRPLVPEGQDLALLALRFLLANPDVTTVIPGARNPRQAAANIRAGQLGALDRDTMAKIDAIVAPGGGRKIWPA
ncbi:MAG: aldo/keto reductase [Phycisphaerales bacterium]|nr:aldo/keto reductase [Phycisphaerales bacterium]